MLKSRLSRLILLLIVALFSFSSIENISAAPPISGFEGWGNVKEITDTKKSWTVTMSKALDSASAIKDNIFITDEENNSIGIEISLLGDGKSIKITPTSDYEIGKTYRLYISNKLKSKDGKAVKKAKLFTFKVVSQAGKSYITGIESTKNSLFIKLSVKCSSEVFKVIVGTDEMSYSVEDETYIRNIVDLKTGDKVTIKAYDSRDKLLETKEYIIP